MKRRPVSARHDGRVFLAGLIAAAALTACGGGGGGDSAPEPTAIPSNLSISAPATADVGGTTQFGSSATTLSGLKYSWDFGDGSSSADAAPSHAYAQGGDYTVTLRVTNEAGASGQAQFAVSVSNMGLVQGLACSGTKQAGWCWQQPTPSGADRYGTFFLDANTGWSVGANGTILKTIDGGKTWLAQYTGVDTVVRSVSFAGANNGWAQADYGALLHTTDGGANWKVSKLANVSPNPSLQVFGTQTLMVKDAGGNLMGSTDGGQTWKTSTFVPTIDAASLVQWSLVDGVLKKTSDFGTTTSVVLDARPASDGSSYSYSNYQLQRIDDQHLLLVRTTQGYVGGNWTGSISYFRTQDGGATWDVPAMQGLPDASQNSPPTFVYAGAGTLLVTSNGSLFRSSDGGGSWTPASAPAGYYYSYGFYGLSDGRLMFYQYGYASISTDGGAHWSSMTLPGDTANSYSTYYGPATVQALSGGAIQLSFGDGSIYRSADAGQTWSTVLASSSVPSSSQIRGFWAFDAKHALGVNSNGELVETKDGGRSWAVKQSGLASAYAPRIVFTSAKIGWLYLGDGRLYRSTDGGESWVTGLNSNFYGSFQFIDANTGFAVSGGRLSRSTDGGISWVDVGTMPSGYTQAVFQSATHGLAIGNGYGVQETNDGGVSWTPRYTGSTLYLNTAAFTDAKTAWVLGSSGDLLQSIDGGSTWQQISLPIASNISLNGIQFLDAKRGWIVGSGGTVLATVDGGKTWQKQASGTSRSLWQVQFVDSKTGWILGENGTLMVSGTGGN